MLYGKRKNHMGYDSHKKILPIKTKSWIKFSIPWPNEGILEKLTKILTNFNHFGHFANWLLEKINFLLYCNLVGLRLQFLNLEFCVLSSFPIISFEDISWKHLMNGQKLEHKENRKVWLDILLLSNQNWFLLKYTSFYRKTLNFLINK